MSRPQPGTDQPPRRQPSWPLLKMARPNFPPAIKPPKIAQFFSSLLVVVGADRAYDAADFVMELRELRATPHVAQNTAGRRSAIDRRTTVISPGPARAATRSTAARRSAKPAARVSSASTTRPWWFSISTWPKAEPRFLTMTFAKQPRIRIGGRGVAGVGPVLAVEVSARVATTIWWLVLIILRAEALQAGPGLDQGAVDREVLAAQELPNPRVAQHRRQEFGRDLTLEQPVAVGRERGRMPYRIVVPEPHEPPVQEVVVELLHQQPLRADRIEGLEQERPQQPLGRNRGSAEGRVERLERARQLAQRVVDDRPDRTQRVIRGHPDLKVHIAEQAARPLILAPHCLIPHLVAHLREAYHITHLSATFSAVC